MQNLNPRPGRDPELRALEEGQNLPPPPPPANSAPMKARITNFLEASLAKDPYRVQFW